MDYIEYLRKKEYQEFNSVSDFIDYSESITNIKRIGLEYSNKNIEKITKKLELDNNLYVFLCAFLFVLKRYGRQNSIVIELDKEDKKLPIGIESNDKTTMKEFISDLKSEVDKYNKGSNNTNDYNKVKFVYGKKKISKDGLLSLNIYKEKDYKIDLYYESTYYEKDNIRYFIKHYKNILDNLLKNIDYRLDDIELTDKEEIELIKNKFNKNYNVIDENATIIDVIEKNVKEYKKKTAVIFNNKSISYEELNEKSNILANKLIKQGIGTNDFVVIVPDRSIEMIIAILAIEKAGAAYVPIDPKYPDDRIEYIIDTCNPKMIFTMSKKINIGKKIPIINITKLDNNGNKNNPVRNQKNDTIAYSIFTSGTTGKPKGVVLRHKGLYNLVFNYQDIYGISNNDTLLQFASIAFDQSVWDIFTILGLGGTLCLVPSDLIEDPRELENYMEKNKVSVAALTPAYIKLLNPDNLPTLKVIESGSAAADYDDLKRWMHKRRVFNTYGPTEATVNTISYEITELNNKVLPIGKPIQNAKIFINNNNHLCGIGEPGELCIAGYGIAKEYLKQPEKTNETFIDCPFEDGKMYRSGDLVKYRYDGQIIYIGRIDDQIKIRGFRIELGEIENCIKELEYIKDVYLLVEKKSDGEKEIDAYVLSDKIISYKEIKEYLSSKLPYYMVPSHIYQVDVLPLTLNGKIDKQKLRSMYKINETECIPPETEFETIALNVYKEVLEEDKIGVTDDFYEIGGSSIKAITIISRLRELGYMYQVCDLLRSKTIRNLGNVKESSCNVDKYISLNDKKYKDIICKKEKELGYEALNISYLTPTQMYMLEAYREHIVGDNHLQYFYNCPKDINECNLKKAINLLPIKNEALTTIIIDDKKQPYQIRFNNRDIEFELIENVTQDEYEKICAEDIIRGFDIEKDPMVRFKLIKLNNGEVKLLFSVSHIIVDGWSVELVMQDLSNIYEQLQSEVNYDKLLKKYTLKEEKSLLEDSLAIINRKETEEAINYWNDYFKTIGNAKTLPYDNNQIVSGNWDIVDWIDEEETKKIKEFCKKISISENTFFELAYAYLLAIASSTNSSFFYKVVSGRDLPVANIDNIVGMLINIIPQTIRIKNNVVKSLQELNDTLLVNSNYDKYDFYHKKVNGKLLMNKGKTIFVFSNYYDLSKSIFEYEFDRDQDEVDLSFFVDEMQNKYHLLITCKKSLYTKKRLNSICKLYRKIIETMYKEGIFDGLYI